MNLQPIPQHIAIICDGNRRWARAHALQAFQGHEKAVQQVIEPLIDHAIVRGVKYLTFWIFSTENWDREKKEVQGLMDLFRSFFTRQIEDLHKKGVCMKMIGDITGFDTDIQEKIAWGVEKTKGNATITVSMAMNYGGRDEILRAMNRLFADILSGKISLDDGRNVDPSEREAHFHTTISRPIREKLFASYLDTAGIPDPDLIVRTSGEQRLSGYLMWEAEYAEFLFPAFHFPEFTPDRLDEAIAEYQKRQRRFGK